jgi:RNA polymerase sigma factor (sigma-70 family)
MKKGKANLQHIIEGCQKGDRQCQKEVFEIFYRKMLGVCFRYAVDADEAKDMVQEAFILAYQKINDYAGKGSFEGWLRRIVVNKSIDIIRRKKMNTFSIDAYKGYDLEQEEEDDASIYSGIKKEIIFEAIQKLSPAYKAVFNLYVIEGYSHQEIADELEISVGTSKSNLAKARGKLKHELKKHLNYQNV